MTPTRIVVDARMLAYPLTGIGRYTLELLVGMTQSKAADWILLSHAKVPEPIRSRFDHRVQWVEGEGRGWAEPWIQRQAGAELGRSREAVFLGLANSVPLRRPRGARFVLVVYDLTFLVAPRWTVLQDLVKGWLVNLPAILRADRLLTISADVRRDLVRRFPRLEHRTIALPPAGTALAPGPGVPPQERRGFLAVGAHPRKNTPVLLDAFASLPTEIRRRHPLFLLARNITSEIRKQISRLGVGDDVRLSPHATDVELGELYRHAVALVYPSRYEGLGLPVAEAMLAGLPSIVPTPSPMAAFLHDGGIALVRVTAPELAQAMLRLVTDRDAWLAYSARAAAAARELRWDRVTPVALEALGLR